MTKIFISYRRSDSAYPTGRIDDRLVDAFGRDNVFKDVDSIPLGMDFREYLTRAVGGCDVLLVVIGDRWLEEDESGNRRIDTETDYVRIEVETALQRKIPVVPILLGTARMPKPEELPPTISDLSFRNATKVRPDPDFAPDVGRIVKAIERLKPGRDGAAKDQQPAAVRLRDELKLKANECPLHPEVEAQRDAVEEEIADREVEATTEEQVLWNAAEKEAEAKEEFRRQALQEEQARRTYEAEEGSTFIATCQCGEMVSLPAEFTGQSTKCPTCGAMLSTPDMAPPPPEIEALVGESRRAVDQNGVRPPRKRRARRAKWAVLGLAAVILTVPLTESLWREGEPPYASDEVGSSKEVSKIVETKVRFHLDHGPWLQSVEYSPGGKRLLTTSSASGSQGSVRVWDADSGEMIMEFPGYGSRVLGARFTPSGERIATFASSGEIRILDSESGDRIDSLQPRSTSLDNVLFVNEEIVYFNGLYGDRIALEGWNLSTNRKLLEVAFDRASMQSWDLEMSNDRRFAAQAGGVNYAGRRSSGFVRIWELSTGSEILSIEEPRRVSRVAWSFDSKLIGYVADHEPNKLNIYEVSSSNLIEEIDVEHGITGIAFSPDGRYVATSSFGGGETRLIDLKTKEQFTFDIHGSYCLCFDPDGKELAVGTSKGRVHVLTLLRD